MRTTILLVVGVFVVLLTMAIPAEAQYYRDYRRVDSLLNAIAGYDRGGYDPYRRRSIYGGGYDPYGYRDPRMTDPCYGADQFYQGVRGTIHAHEGKMHFRPCDPTNSRIGTVAGGALGAGGGAIIGAIGGRKGAGVGAVGGGILGGIIASRHAHNNCIVMSESAIQPVQTSQTFQPSVVETPVPHQEQEPIVEAPTKKLVRNRFEDVDAKVRIYDGSKRIFELQAGGDDEIDVPSNSKIWWEAYLKNPKKNGKKEWTPIYIGRGVENLPEKSGWEFGNPETRPSL